MAKEDEIAGLEPGQPFGQAGRTIIRNRFAAMWAYRDGTLAGDEDALHDMRVASRRLRAAFDVFAPAFRGGAYRRLHRITARLTDELGVVRDGDVMLLTLQKYRKGLSADERPGINDLIENLSAERAAARDGLRAFFDQIDGKGYAARMERLFGQEESSNQEQSHG